MCFFGPIYLKQHQIQYPNKEKEYIAVYPKRTNGQSENGMPVFYSSEIWILIN